MREFLSGSSNHPIDQKLWRKAWDVFGEIYQEDPDDLCTCGRPGAHKDMCKFDDVIVGFVSALYKSYGGRRAKVMRYLVDGKEVEEVKIL